MDDPKSIRPFSSSVFPFIDSEPGHVVYPNRSLSLSCTETFPYLVQEIRVLPVGSSHILLFVRPNHPSLVEYFPNICSDHSLTLVTSPWFSEFRSPKILVRNIFPVVFYTVHLTYPPPTLVLCTVIHQTHPLSLLKLHLSLLLKHFIRSHTQSGDTGLHLPFPLCRRVLLRVERPNSRVTSHHDHPLYLFIPSSVTKPTSTPSGKKLLGNYRH